MKNILMFNVSFYFLLFSLTSISSSCNSNSNQEIILESGNAAKIYTLKGFRKYELGADLSQYPELKLVVADRTPILYINEVYFNPNEDNTIGDIEIEDVEYTFQRGKLHKISFIAKNNSVGIIKSLENKYGKYEADYHNQIYTWSNSDVLLTVEGFEDEALNILGNRDRRYSSSKVTFLSKITERLYNQSIDDDLEKSMESRVNDL